MRDRNQYCDREWAKESHSTNGTIAAKAAAPGREP
jgi:hypothetical protein